jgi:hypothetical protein
MCLKVRDLYDSFTGIIDLYREIDYGIDYLDDDPHDHGDFLFDLIYQDWWSWIFSDKFDEDKKYDFWEELTTTDYFDKDVPERDPDTLYKLDEGPFEYSWYEFLDYLTTKRRFTITDEGIRNFIRFLPDLIVNLEIEIPIGTPYYRSRLGPEDELTPYPKDKMGAPPPEKTMEGGRANPPGIAFLYLSNDQETAILEVRPWNGASISVGTFVTKRKLRLVDLTNELRIDDPFAYGNDLKFALQDRRLLWQLGSELSKPVNPYTKNIDYVPTQYLTEITRNQEFDGMIYPSALAENKNIVLFDIESAECEDVKLYKVDLKVKVDMEEL